MESAKPSVKPFRVLSLDGGGIRGLYTACVLSTVAKRISRKSQPDIGKAFDLIVGTSTGGILAAGLAFGLCADDIIKMYSDHGPCIFPNPMPEPVEKVWGKGCIKAFNLYKSNQELIDWLWNARRRAAANAEQLRTALTELFRDTTLAEMYERRGIAVCIPSIRMFKETARVFKTGHVPRKHMDDSVALVDVCMATSAAPLYFPLASVASTNVDVDGYYVDGGLWANNPLIIGLIEALEMSEYNQPVQILSVGTCPVPSGSSIKGDKDVDPGVLGWRGGSRALSVSMNAQANGITNSARFLASQFERRGKPIKIIRFPQTPPSPNHLSLLKLDLATIDAINHLKLAGEEDGINVVQWWQQETQDGQIVGDIFGRLVDVEQVKDTI